MFLLGRGPTATNFQVLTYRLQKLRRKKFRNAVPTDSNFPTCVELRLVWGSHLNPTITTHHRTLGAGLDELVHAPLRDRLLSLPTHTAALPASDAWKPHDNYMKKWNNPRVDPVDPVDWLEQTCSCVITPSKRSLTRDELVTRIPMI